MSSAARAWPVELDTDMLCFNPVLMDIGALTDMFRLGCWVTVCVEVTRVVYGTLPLLPADCRADGRGCAGCWYGRICWGRYSGGSWLWLKAAAAGGVRRGVVRLVSRCEGGRAGGVDAGIAASGRAAAGAGSPNRLVNLLAEVPVRRISKLRSTGVVA